jgi:hypothetical protein
MATQPLSRALEPAVCPSSCRAVATPRGPRPPVPTERNPVVGGEVKEARWSGTGAGPVPHRRSESASHILCCRHRSFRRGLAKAEASTTNGRGDGEPAAITLPWRARVLASTGRRLTPQRANPSDRCDEPDKSDKSDKSVQCVHSDPTGRFEITARRVFPASEVILFAVRVSA